MEPALKALVTSVTNGRQASSGKYNYVTHFGPSAKWNIAQVNYDALWSGYCKILSEDPKSLLCLAEAPTDQMPVSVKFRFNYMREDEDTSLYDDNFVLRLVQVTQGVLDNLFQLTEDPSRLVCAIAESDSFWFVDENNQPTEDESSGHAASELILHFPFCRIEANKYAQHVVPAIVQQLRSKNIRRMMNCDPKGDWDQIIDSNSMVRPVTIFGSVDHPLKSKMKFTGLVPVVTEENDDIEQIELDLNEWFDPMSHAYVVHNIIKESVIAANPDKSYWLPLFFSNAYYEGVTLPKAKILTPAHSNHSIIVDDYILGTNTMGLLVEEHSLDLCELFIALWNPVRVLEYDMWHLVGKALYRSSNGSPRGRDIWIRYTEDAIRTLNMHPSQLPDFLTVDLRERMEEDYEEFSSSFITHRTLAWYARIDNPKEYDRWHTNWYMRAIDIALSCNDTDICRAIYRAYWLEIACAGITSNTWYVYNNNKWKQSDGAVHLEQTITYGFVKILFDQRSNMRSDMFSDTDPENRKRTEGSIAKLDMLIKRLKGVGYLSKYIRGCRSMFYVEHFSTVLDTSLVLLGVPNGIIERIQPLNKPKRLIFRDGKPEDYVAKSCLARFPTTYHNGSKQVLKVRDWFSKMFAIDRDLEHHMLKHLSSTLIIIAERRRPFPRRERVSTVGMS